MLNIQNDIINMGQTTSDHVPIIYSKTYVQVNTFDQSKQNNANSTDLDPYYYKKLQTIIYIEGEQSDE